MTQNNKSPLFKIILLSSSGFFMFVCMDSLAKFLGSVMPVTQAVWGRFFFHFIAMLIYFLIFKPKLNLTKNFKIQILRSLLMVTATFFMFNSLQRFDLVDIYVVFFSAPLIVAILSAYFLKDVLSVKGFLLMLLSFGSIVYSLGPSMKVLSPELIFPLVPPLCWALYQFFTKLISGNNDPFAAVFYTAIIGTIVSSVYISFNWVPLEKNIYWIPLIIMGIAGFVSHFILIYAIQLSNLSFVTNFQYSQLLWSTIINFLIFGVPFDLNKIFGVIGIIVFGILFIRTEGKKNN
ncbi:DMT family transporter [Candidatus Pelagibacter sp.]|jgi:drug/metabolite transporter (DMT)-like permease|nr:DMT family transporter [Candidatus Pelagibacter sp.]MDA7838390.1 DMT family transporter [Candidatus Pelagibacter sp.]MDB4193935.1 DMT family transporter [Candidatus Pelagibacter sp.]MDB4246817.1 DMT family transporter [Candidatus Pelagibacter sp.]MDC3281067.1 DMT family transporter [Candidatus Pelagibacter sp.]|tara:strand:+ start:258 stop:1130 length:873 start_codon:yes stop_codon:yes gene_type:complete